MFLYTNTYIASFKKSICHTLYHKGQQTFCLESQRVNNRGFANHTFFIVTTQLSGYTIKTTMENI